MPKRISFFLFACATILFFACSSKPSDKEIEAKLLRDYKCGDKAEVSHMRILSTKETKGTDIKHVYQYTITGEIAWPEGCNEAGKETAAGSRELFEKLVVLTDSDDGWK